VRLYGYCVEAPTVCLIMELLPQSLEQRLYEPVIMGPGGVFVPISASGTFAGGTALHSEGLPRISSLHSVLSVSTVASGMPPALSGPTTSPAASLLLPPPPTPALPAGPLTQPHPSPKRGFGAKMRRLTRARTRAPASTQPVPQPPPALPPHEFLTICVDVASALVHVHSRPQTRVRRRSLVVLSEDQELNLDSDSNAGDSTAGGPSGVFEGLGPPAGINPAGGKGAMHQGVFLGGPGCCAALVFLSYSPTG
jgi:hypothetical protein